MNYKLNPKLKPLVSNLLRINIGQYLKSNDFKHLMLEHNHDEIWDQAKDIVSNNKTVILIGMDPSSDYEEAYQIVLNAYFMTKPQFFNFVELTLSNFVQWDNGKTNITKVLESLENLGIAPSQIQNIKQIQKTRPIKIPKNIPEKFPASEKINMEIDPKLCFVIMPFTNKLNPIYESIIKPVLKNLKYSPLRADEIFSSKSIVDDICTNIKKAKFLIADLTDRNPNVFYELGLAHAADKEVILLTQNLEDIPFDLRPLRMIVYKDSIPGADLLKASLRSFIVEIKNKKNK